MGVVVLGGGAAGFFAAVTAAQKHKVILLERTNQLLSKVRISGGGRCNVTHECFDPKILSKHYPRGSLELLGPFYYFQPKETIAWFEERGVLLKTEEDGRIFPASNSSSTIIDCLLNEAKKLGVEIKLQCKIESIDEIDSDRIILATGSHPSGYRMAKECGHTIVEPVPSLFTFNVPTSPLKEFSGVSVPHVQLSIKGTPLTQTGALLITHFGFSGPAVLKLSAFGARILHEMHYQAELEINWAADCDVYAYLLEQKKITPEKWVMQHPLFHLPKSLWRHFTAYYNKRFADLSHKEIAEFAQKLHSDVYKIDGKTTHKEEFVTAGGIKLNEINFKTMESKLRKGLFFAGEILDIDGVTGGFNFQNAWTTGFIAGSSI